MQSSLNVNEELSDKDLEKLVYSPVFSKGLNGLLDFIGTLLNAAFHGGYVIFQNKAQTTAIAVYVGMCFGYVRLLTMILTNHPPQACLQEMNRKRMESKANITDKEIQSDVELLRIITRFCEEGAVDEVFPVTMIRNATESLDPSDRIRSTEFCGMKSLLTMLYIGFFNVGNTKSPNRYKFVEVIKILTKEKGNDMFLRAIGMAMVTAFDDDVSLGCQILCLYN